MNVIPFPHAQNPSTEIAQYVRVGDSHKSFGDLRAAGYLPVRRVVVEASRIIRQAELLKLLQNEGTEIVLDLEAAELSSVYRFNTSARNAPWLGGLTHQPLRADDFTQDRIDAMARLAVEFSVNAVLAPTHFLKDPLFSGWLKVDLANCERLRRALDKEGGSSIAIDYPVIQTAAGLADAIERKVLVEGLSSMPVQQIWFRVSGLGKDAGPSKTRALIRQLSGFHNLGMPIVLDYCSGLNAQAAVAFGAASGVSFGIMELDSFDASGWHKPMPARDPDAPYGRRTYVAAPGLGRTFERREFELLARATGGRRIMLQGEYSSASSVDEMVRDRRAQAALQAVKSLQKIEQVPDLNRTKFFLDGPLRDMERRARDVSRLRPTQAAADAAEVDLQSLLRRTSQYCSTIEKVAVALEAQHSELGTSAPRARPCWRKKREMGSARRELE